MIKNKIKYTIYLVLVSMLYTVESFAQDFRQQTYNDANSATELQPLVCKMIKNPDTRFDNEIPDPACVAENNRRAQARSVMVSAQGQATKLSEGDGTVLVAPVAPQYTCGSLQDDSPEFFSCRNDYNAKYSVYQRDLNVYNMARSEMRQGEITAENAAIAEHKAKSAAATLAEIKEKNEMGKQKADNTAMLTMGISIAAGIRGAVCSAQCSGSGGGCCTQAPYWFGTAAAFMLLNMKAKKQSSQHALSASEACKSMNQLSSQPTNCVSNPKPMPVISTITYDPVTGVCSPADSEICKQKPTIGAAPPSVKDGLKNSAFAGTKGLDGIFSLQPDGSMKFKNGKVFKPSDFDSVQSLVAAGLSPSQAKELFSSMNSTASGLEKTGLGKEALATKKPVGSGFGQSFTDGLTTVVDVTKGEGSGKTFSDDVKPTEFQSEERKPSSEGLVKDFNGEVIGVAGDDIFMMMNRRYRLKKEQDSFIAQDLK